MPARPFVYIASRLPDDCLERVKAACDMSVREAAGRVTPEEALASLEGASGMLNGNGTRLDHAFFAEVPGTVRVISQIGVGYDNVDVPAATEAGILICNTPGVLTDAVADLTLGLIISISRRLPEFATYTREGGWGVRPGPAMGADVHGKTLGIVGLGRIGRAVARRASAFRLRVLFHDRFLDGGPEADIARYRALDDLLRESDYVTLHVDLNETSHAMIGARELALMKPTAFLINTSRGPVIDQEALTEALQRRQIAGAALDVLEQEPPRPDDPILKLENVMILPHTGTTTNETRRAMIDLAVDNLLDAVRGLQPRAMVNPEAWSPHSR